MVFGRWQVGGHSIMDLDGGGEEEHGQRSRSEGGK